MFVAGVLAGVGGAALLAPEPPAPLLAPELATDPIKPGPLDRAFAVEIEGRGPDTALAELYRQFEERWEREMEAAAQTLAGRLNAEDRALLVRSQRSWLAYRDTQKALHEMIYTPGARRSLPTMYYAFHARRDMLTVRARALDLRDLQEARQTLILELAMP